MKFDLYIRTILESIKHTAEIAAGLKYEPEKDPRPGNDFYVKNYTPGIVIKLSLHNKKQFNKYEKHHLEWLKANSNTGAFARIYELGPNYALQEKINVDTAKALMYSFGHFYLKQIKAGLFPDEYLPFFDRFGQPEQFMNKVIIDPKSTFNWKDLFRVIENHRNVSEWHIFEEQARDLYDLHQRLKKINWSRNPFAATGFSKLDLHHSNFGYNADGKLVAFDY